MRKGGKRESGGGIQEIGMEGGFERQGNILVGFWRIETRRESYECRVGRLSNLQGVYYDARGALRNWTCVKSY